MLQPTRGVLSGETWEGTRDGLPAAAAGQTAAGQAAAGQGAAGQAAQRPGPPAAQLARLALGSKEEHAPSAAGATGARGGGSGGEESADKIGKKIRNVDKKLRQIVELKELVAGGKSLEANQLEKIKVEEPV